MPSPRAFTQIAYDPAHSQVVLFGGATNAGDQSDTWTWDGIRWTLHNVTTAPPPLELGAMAYDAAHGYVLLLGFDCSVHPCVGDTWSWDGSSWTHQNPVTKPPDLTSANMAFDVATNNIVLFGGASEPNAPGCDQFGFCNGTWTWTGNNWVLLSPASSPFPRFEAAMAYDAATGNIVLEGGDEAIGTQQGVCGNDTWAWDGTTWTQHFPAHQPPPSYHTQMAYDAALGSAVLYNTACLGAKPFGTTWTWNGADWTQAATTTIPNTLDGEPIAYDASTQAVVMPMGDIFESPNSSSCPCTFTNETWQFTGSDWRGDGPTTRELVGRNRDELAFCSVCAGDPANPSTGALSDSFTDIYIPGRGLPLSLTRTYTSSLAAQSGPLGNGWAYNAGPSLTLNSQTGVLTLNDEAGAQIAFTPVGSNYEAPARVLASLVKNGDGSYTYTRADHSQLNFSAARQLAQESDRNGYVTSFGYSSGNLAKVTDSASRSLSFKWTGGHIASVTDANVSPARVVMFQYNDGLGNLTDVIDVNGGHSKFVYDSTHHLTVMKDPTCFATVGCPGVQMGYDSTGRVATQKDQLNRQTTFSYSGATTLVTDPKGNAIQYTFAENELVQEVKGFGTPQAAITGFAYGADLALLSTVDPNGNAMLTRSDGNGNMLTVVDPMRRQTVRSYNGFNEVLTEQDPNGVMTTNTYDGNGNLASVSRPLTGTIQTQTTSYLHQDAAHPGDVTAVIDPDGSKWVYAYDANGYRTSVTDPLGNQSTSTYNAIGWRLGSVTPKGNVAGCGCASQFTTTYSYVKASGKTNEFGDVAKVTDPLGHSVNYSYDADRNRLAFVDADGNKTSYVYDLANERTAVHRPGNPATVLATDYNPDGTVQDQKDGKGSLIARYGYDSLGRVTGVTDALGNFTSYTYDGAGNRLTQQDPMGNCAQTPKIGCITFGYDADNELTAVSYSDGATPNITNITHDADGQRTGMTDGTGTSIWVWDSLNRLTSYASGTGAQLQYQYNLRSLVTQITYPAGQSLSRGYDTAGRWTSVQDWNGNSTTFGYDPNSNLSTETLPAGTGITDTFGFDKADNLASISDTKSGAPPTVIFSATYTRDKANQLATDSSVPPTVGAYKYSALNQLCYAGSSNSTSCATPPSGAMVDGYDTADNLTRIGSTVQSFNAADELCWTLNGSSSNACATAPTGATTFGYDSRGNRVNAAPATGPPTTFGFNQANQLASWAQGAASATYSYNGDGLRSSKTTGGTTAKYVWDSIGSIPLLVQDGTTNYVYGPEGLPLEQVSAAGTLWLHHDQIGSTRLVTDGIGTTQATYTYDPYGNLAGFTGSVTNPFRFSGEYLDQESGLYYLRARYYEASTAQFLSRDPRTSVTRAPYGYTAGNPLNAADPSGLDWCNQQDLTHGLRQFACGAARWSVTIAIQLGNATFNHSPNSWCSSSSWHELYPGQCDQVLVLVEHSTEFADAADKIASACTVAGQEECAVLAGAWALTCNAIAEEAGFEPSDTFRKKVAMAMLDEVVGRLGKPGDIASRIYNGYELFKNDEQNPK